MVKPSNAQEKVYSIWICTEAPENAQNTITQYHMAQENIIGDAARTSSCDLLTVVVVYLDPESSTKNGAELHRLLSVLLSKTLTPAVIEMALETQYGIKISL